MKKILILIGIIYCFTFTQLYAEDTKKLQNLVMPPQIRKAPTLEELQKQYSENEIAKYRIEGAINMLMLQKQEKEDKEKYDKYINDNKESK